MVALDEQVPYQALYRRFRPQRFTEVLGQGHVTRALRAAVRDGRVAHAYLFSGPRGTGKTSTARILAMALNCQSPEDGEPCGRCESCVAVRQGTSLDVQELDSATNRGIDEMRDLLSRVALGSPGRWKVYIVDEVHQITSAAAAALLKTLEEPPAHVIFVLATTDPQKVLDTIRSRTQHFEFRLLGAETLTSLLSQVAQHASIDLTAEAIDLVVRRGHGSARDALSALDQVAAGGTVEDDSGTVSGIVAAIVERDAGSALVRVAEAAAAGLDARRLGTELLEYLRNGFLATRAPALVLLSEAARAEVESQARELGPAALVRSMDLIGEALIDMRDSADPRTTLEVALVRLAAVEVDDSRTALVERIERLERALAAGDGVASSAAVAGHGSAPGQAPTLAETPTSTGPPPAVTVASTTSPSATSPSAGTPTMPAHPAPAGRPSPAAAGPSSLGPPPPLPRPGRGSPPPRPQVPGAPAPSGAADPGRPSRGPSRPAPASDRPPAVPAGASAAHPPARPPAGRPAAPGGAVPSREDLTVAWGDRILPGLRPAVKVYVASGRFLPSEDGTAVYAVPDRGLLARAETSRGDVEAALAAHFGRPVPLRLVLDDGSTGGALTAGGAAPAGAARPDESQGDPGSRYEEAPEDPSDYDWAEMEEAPGAVVSPEQRLLDAFPGAEEVQP